MAKLTKTQREALEEIIKCQWDAGKELVFHYKESLTGAGLDIYPPKDKERIIFVPFEYIGLWHECGYIFRGQKPTGESTFILRQEALDLPPITGS